MLLLRACPRCRGAILDYKVPTEDSPLCITCEWRGVNIPTDVRTEVLAHLGRPRVPQLCRQAHRHRQVSA